MTAWISKGRSEHPNPGQSTGVWSGPWQRNRL